MRVRHTAYLYILIGITGVILFFFGLGKRDFWGTPEARTAEIAREMLESGEWLVPHLNGMPRLTKPPLYFWSVAVLARAVNDDVITEYIARIPAAVCAVGVLFFIMAIGTMVYDRRTGFYTALICATMFSFFSYARYALLDMMLVFFETAMVFFFIRGMTYPERKKSSYCALYLCAAGALYVKGPVGLFVPFMGIVVYLWKSRRLSEVRALNPLLGISCALMCVLPWVLYVYKTVPDIWGVISHETVNRFFNPYDHIRSFLHFIFQTPFCMMPWTVCIPLVVWDIVKHRRLKSYLFPVSFFLPAFLFFSLCPSKQSHYLLPLYPFMALAVSKALQNFAVYARARSKESLFCRLTCPTPLKAGVVAAGIFLGILGYMVLIPWLNSRISVEPFCRQLDKIIKPEDHLVAFDYAKPYFCFYLRRIIPEILTEEELEEYLIEYSAYVIMERENWEKLGHINGHVVLNYENDKDKIVVIKKGSPHARFITRTFNHNTCI